MDSGLSLTRRVGKSGSIERETHKCGSDHSLVNGNHGWERMSHVVFVSAGPAVPSVPPPGAAAAPTGAAAGRGPAAAAHAGGQAQPGLGSVERESPGRVIANCYVKISPKWSMKSTCVDIYQLPLNIPLCLTAPLNKSSALIELKYWCVSPASVIQCVLSDTAATSHHPYPWHPPRLFSKFITYLHKLRLWTEGLQCNTAGKIWVTEKILSFCLEANRLTNIVIMNTVG